MKLRRRIGRNVTALRENAGLSAEALAISSRVPLVTLVRIEAGEAGPNAAEIVKISGVLNATPNQLLHGAVWDQQQLRFEFRRLDSKEP